MKEAREASVGAVGGRARVTGRAKRGPGMEVATVATLLALGTTAHAQLPNLYPNGSVPDAPRTLDPGSSGNQAPAPAPAPAPRRQDKPNIMVVGPDGKVTYTPDQDQGTQTGYYVDNGASGGAAVTEPAESYTGPVPELHVVRKGDTLWDICFLYFNDPWQWPKIWSYNPQITNPHWIYPGDLVRLLPRGVFAGSGQPDLKEPDKSADKTDKTPQPAPQRRLEVGIKQTAFVEKSDLDKSITIDGSVDEKVLLGPGDQVYLAYPEGKAPEVGKRYSIYVPDNPVKGPKGDVGAYVHILGEVEVVSVKQEKRARGVITGANQEIERGLKVGPLIKEYKTVPPKQPKVDAQGSIIAMLAQAQLLGQGELVFIDLGEGAGVEVGNRMFVVRRGDAYPASGSLTIGQDDKRFPARALGGIVIVEVGPKVSVGLVTLSVQEMGVGDNVMMQKAQ